MKKREYLGDSIFNWLTTNYPLDILSSPNLGSALGNFVGLPTVSPESLHSDELRLQATVKSMIEFGKILTAAGVTNDLLIETASFSMSLYRESLQVEIIDRILDSLRENFPIE